MHGVVAHLVLYVGCSEVDVVVAVGQLVEHLVLEGDFCNSIVVVGIIVVCVAQSGAFKRGAIVVGHRENFKFIVRQAEQRSEHVIVAGYVDAFQGASRCAVNSHVAGECFGLRHHRSVYVATAVEHKLGRCCNNHLLGYNLLLSHVDGDECATVFGWGVAVVHGDGVLVSGFHVLDNAGFLVGRAVELSAGDFPAERCFAVVEHEIALSASHVACELEFAVSIAHNNLVVAECFGDVAKVDHHHRVGDAATHIHLGFVAGADGEVAGALEIAVGERGRHAVAGGSRHAIVTALEIELRRKRACAAIFANQAFGVVYVNDAVFGKRSFVACASNHVGFGVEHDAEVCSALTLGEELVVRA